MRVINLTSQLNDHDAEKYAGVFLGDDAFDILINEDADVYKPNGEPLIKFRRRVLPANICAEAYPALRTAATPTSNRGVAGGAITEENPNPINQAVGKTSKHKYQALKKDGTISNTNRGAEVNSGIIGYFDRGPRFPYCRTTAYNLEKPERFRAALPFIRAVNDVFATQAPDRYANQRAAIEQTHPDFYIHGTVFTTVTVNKNWRTAVHKDAGDYAHGFGVMSVLQAGQYEGCYLVWPKYRVAVDMRTSDVCLADVHEWHGNTPLKPKGLHERISCIFYYRANMWRCGSADDELTRAQHRKLGEALYEDDETGLPTA